MALGPIRSVRCLAPVRRSEKRRGTPQSPLHRLKSRPGKQRRSTAPSDSGQDREATNSRQGVSNRFAASRSASATSFKVCCSPIRSSAATPPSASNALCALAICRSARPRSARSWAAFSSRTTSSDFAAFKSRSIASRSTSSPRRIPPRGVNCKVTAKLIDQIEAKKGPD